MSHYYADVKAGIVTALQQATNAKQVYNYEEVKPAGYPAITVTPAQGEGSFLDTMRVRRDFTFSVKVYQERIEVGASEAERIITALVDQCLALFENSSNTTLSNTVVFTKPPKERWGYQPVPDADVRMCDITVVAEAAQ